MVVSPTPLLMLLRLLMLLLRLLQLLSRQLVTWLCLTASLVVTLQQILIQTRIPELVVIRLLLVKTLA
ncbi:hypothetical protein B7T09_21520 [Cronobacter sakazakii]|nr:hypothetical protein B7T09_21520 [Cronobacter sakazakii]